VATLLIEGPGAEELVQTRFQAKSGRPLASHPPDRLVFGHFALPVGPEPDVPPGEEVVVRRHSPESVELHCHGGFAALSLIQKALAEQGARIVGWQDWVREHHADPITAAAWLALAGARTEQTAMILLEQYQGALRRAIAAVQQALASGDASAALGQLQNLLLQAPTGLHLVEPWQVVLAGPPNVGKSSLINALLGYQRAIVHPTPGTTRDVVTAITALEGWPVELSDTAGLRESAEVIEQAGVALAHQRLAAADLVVLVFDQSQPWTEADESLVAAQPAALVVFNKADLPSPAGLARPSGLATSAIKGQGIEPLIHAIVQRLVPQPPAPGTAVPFTAEQVHLLQTAQIAAEHGDFPTAAAVLEQLWDGCPPKQKKNAKSCLDSSS
jgi:tRNA modification GTPase